MAVRSFPTVTGLLFGGLFLLFLACASPQEPPTPDIPATVTAQVTAELEGLQAETAPEPTVEPVEEYAPPLAATPAPVATPSPTPTTSAITLESVLAERRESHHADAKEEEEAVAALMAGHDINDEQVYKIADGNLPRGGLGSYILIGCYAGVVDVSAVKIFTPNGETPDYNSSPSSSRQPLSHVAIVHGSLNPSPGPNYCYAMAVRPKGTGIFTVGFGTKEVWIREFRMLPGSDTSVLLLR